MQQPNCVVDGCVEPIYQGRTYCGSHFMRFYRYGDPLHRPVRVRIDVTGQRFGLLTALRMEGNAWQCQCDCGAMRVVRYADLNRGSARSCGSAEHRLSDDAGYGAAHWRVRAERGSARDHGCSDCGQPANHWSYDHSDSDERMEVGRGPYSLKPSHYQPRCVSCHKVFDLKSDALDVQMLLFG